jgi:gluconolactonase
MFMKKACMILLFATLVPGCKKKDALKYDTVNKETKTKGEIVVVDDQLKTVIDTNAPIEIIAQGYDWSEGPLWLEREQKLIFSDVPRNTIYSWSEKGGDTEYLKPSGFTGDNFKGSEPGSNGLTLNNQGELVLCQHGNRAVSVMKSGLDNPRPSYETLASAYDGKRFNSPNDLIFDSDANLYFTDPPYGLPGGMDDPEKDLDFQGVYLVRPDGEVSLLDDKLTRPNGLALSPDEKTLYVANSDPQRAVWMTYELDKNRSIVSEKLFFDATDWVAKEKGLPDGLKVDNGGNVFATGPGGVWIFSPEGKHLGTIKTGEATANCAFNADKSVLYMTADSYILRLKIK